MMALGARASDIITDYFYSWELETFISLSKKRKLKDSTHFQGLWKICKAR